MNKNETFAEKIIRKKNICAVNIMKCYQEIVYGGGKIIKNLKERKNDEKMLKTIIKEIEELSKELF